jgi:hypothetical protein
MTIKQAIFALDDDGFAFPGFHDPAITWNGFVCPSFTPEVAARIAQHCNLVLRDGAYVENTDEDGAEEIYRVGADGRYAIGAYAWCWWDVS